MVERAFADVEAGRIVLRTPFSNLLLCKRIPGAWWDASRKAWTYPATPQHAALVRTTIPRLSASERFSALAAQKPASPKPQPAMAAVDLFTEEEVRAALPAPLGAALKISFVHSLRTRKA